MRIESAVACPTTAGEQAKEKAASDSTGSLFMNIMDCFRALLSGSSSGDGTGSGQVAAATEKSTDRGQKVPADSALLPTLAETPASRLADTSLLPTLPETPATRLADTSLLPTLPETPATRLADVRADNPDTRENRAEGLEASVGRVPLASAGVLFQSVVPALAANGRADSGTVDPAMRPTNATGREAFNITVSGTPFGASQQSGIPGFATSLQDGTPGGEAVTREHAGEDVEDPDASEAGTSEASFDSENGEQGYEAATPQSSSPASIQTQLAAAAQATAPALMMGARAFQADGSSRSAADTQVPSSFSANSTPHAPRGESVEPKVSFTAISSAPWMPHRVGSVSRGSLNQSISGALKNEAAPEATAAPGGSSAYARITRTVDGIGPDGEVNVGELLAGSQSAIQKLAAAPSQPTTRQEANSGADLQPGIPESKAGDQPPSQSDGAARPAGALRTGTAVDAAMLALESEKAVDGRGRLRTAAERGAQEGSAISSLSGTARDAQAALQATTGVKDVKAPSFVFEVAERISSAVAGARGEVTIQLKPDQFGRMSIVAESGASGILARITTESASLKQYLESNLPALQQALHEQGLRVERIDVMVQDGLSQHQSASQWQQNLGHAPGGHEGGRNARFAAPALAEPAEPANEITLDAAILGVLHPHSTFHTIA